MAKDASRMQRRGEEEVVDKKGSLKEKDTSIFGENYGSLSSK